MTNIFFFSSKVTMKAAKAAKYEAGLANSTDVNRKEDLCW